MSRYYLRYTMPYFYRTEYKGPKDSLTLMGQPGIDGVCSTQAMIKRLTPKGAAMPEQWGWEIIMLTSGQYDDDQGRPVITVASSRKAFDSQHAAARDADAYIGRHHHISVLSGDPKPAGESWIQKATRLWREWEATLAVAP